jgi:hypothetical protein
MGVLYPGFQPSGVGDYSNERLGYNFLNVIQSSGGGNPMRPSVGVFVVHDPAFSRTRIVITRSWPVW